MYDALKQLKEFVKENRKHKVKVEGVIVVFKTDRGKGSGTLCDNDNGIKLRLIEEAKFQQEKIDVARKLTAEREARPSETLKEAMETKEKQTNYFG